MSLYQFLLAFRGRLGAFFVVLAATVLAGAVTSFLLPKSYEATVSLLVDAKDEQTLRNSIRSIALPQERLSYLQTQMDILASRRVASKVVHDLNLAQDPSLRADFEKNAGGAGSIEDWLIRKVLSRFKVESSQSNVIRANFSSGDAYFSARVANAFAKAYTDTILELRVEPTREAAVWFDDQLKRLRANLEDAEAKLTEYHRKQGIVSADERLDVETARLTALSDQVVKAQQETSQWNSRERQAQKYAGQGGSLESLPDVLDNPFIQRIKADLVLGEVKMQELATQYGSNHPQYQRQLSENRNLRERLNAEMRNIVAGIESSARQSRQREADVATAMEKQRARVLDLKEHRGEAAVLRRNVESAERAYDTAMQRFVENQVDSRANQTNVTVLSPAVAPTRPSHPNIVLNIAISVGVGAMLGIGMVILMEMSDRRMRSPVDLELRFDRPVLAVLGPWRPAAAALPDWSQRVGKSLPSSG